LSAGNGDERELRLKAKEKILVQLYLHRFDSDEHTYPFEVTQKGLSEHLGLRRSHVATALQELVKEGLVTVVKAHVEGADRRQNAYCITSGGLEKGASIRERLFSIEVTFEDTEGTRSVKISEIVSSQKASLTSVIAQLDKGGPVREEIAIVTKPEKKLISVFCPTCKKQIEVDNVFQEEEVGFDCPGCGRPYRIVPARRKEAMPPMTERAKSTVIVATMLVAFAVTFVFLTSPSALLVRAAIFATFAGIAAWAVISFRKPNIAKQRTRLSAVIYTIILTPVLLVFWHLMVATVDLEDALKTLGPIWVAIVAAYLGIAYTIPDIRGDFLACVGILMILLATATMFLVELGEIDVGMAMIAGISGAVLVVLSTFRPVDRDALVLDAGLSVGAFLLLLTAAVLIEASEDTMDIITSGAIALLGVFLISLRIARELTGAKDLSAHLLGALPLSLAVTLFMIGLLLLRTEVMMPGIIHMGGAAFFGYLGVKQVFNKDWPYRLPMTTMFTAVQVLIVSSGLLT